MKKVLITGSTGFVGKHLIDLLTPDYEVVTLTTDMVERYKLITDIETIKPDVIVHLAAKTTNWFKYPQLLFEVNVVGVINLFEAIAQAKEKFEGYDPKVVHVGSSEAYGKTNMEFVNEDAVLNPVNLYGASKASGDRIAYAYSQSKKINVVIARPFTHTGPGQRLGFFVPDMASQIVRLEGTDNPVLKVGNLTAMRDYLDVRDVVRAYRELIELDIQPGEVFNISSQTDYTMEEILGMLLENSDTDFELVEDPTRMRPSDIKRLCGDSSKLRTRTTWRPQIKLDQTIADTLYYWRGML